MTGTQKEKTNFNIYFSSDQHYGHHNVIGFCNRPFKNVQEMNQAMIDNWNKMVRPEDLCIFVGDVFMNTKPKDIEDILSKLNGNRKILVFGNHDRERSKMMKLGFTLVVESMEMEIAGEKVLISHYPYRMNKYLYKYLKLKKKAIKFLNLFGFNIKQIYFEKYHERRPIDNGQFLIHGHTHDKEKTKGKMIHVGVDAWNFKPVSITAIANEINKIKEKIKKGENIYEKINNNNYTNRNDV